MSDEIIKLAKFGSGRDWIGLDAVAAYGLIIRRVQEISAVTVVWFDPPPVGKERVALNSTEAAFVKNALEAKSGSPLSFSEALITSMMAVGVVETKILDLALFHKTPKSSSVTIRRRDVIAGKLSELVAAVRRPQIVALLSEVRMENEETRHLPFLDFMCSPSEANVNLALSIALKIFGSPCLLLDSGGSYHAVGANPVRWEMMVQMLAQSILCRPAVDVGYVAHQLIEGCCALRMSRGGSSDSVPVVVAAG